MRQTKTAALLPAVILAASICALSNAKDEKSVSSPGKALVFPALEWTRTFPDKITGMDMAEKTGDLVVGTNEKVYCFRRGPDAKWTAGRGKGWKHLDDLGISWDGKRVMFQTDVKKKKHTEAMNLTMHMYDAQGAELWEKPNPWRYQDAMLSPSGRYIIIGEMLHGGAKVMDNNLNMLWQKDMQFWYLAFDPLERYIFDGEGGILYTMEGEQVWDFGRYTRILSVSDNAEYVMTSYYRTGADEQRMFLMGRLALKKIELSGSGGCVSPDGTYTAYVNSDKKLVVYRTKELLAHGAKDLPPLFSAGFIKPWNMNLSRDNKSLFVHGRESALSSGMMLVDLTKMQKAWAKPVADSIRTTLLTEDNKLLAVKWTDRAVKMYQCW